jgi:hypothetical protein
MAQGQPRQIVHETPPISKLIRAKWTGGVDQAVKHLLCKYEAQSSNSSPIKKERKKKRQKMQGRIISKK